MNKNNLSTGFLWSDALFICVDTPSSADGSINLDYIFTATRQMGELLKETDNFKLVVIKSTVIPGTTQEIINLLESVSGKKYNDDFTVAMIPEFLREGSAIKDFLKPDRIVIGVDNPKAQNLLEIIYNQIKAPKIIVDIETAEFSKYASNAFLALKISFANELANVVDHFNLTRPFTKVNVDDITEIMGMDHRISPAFFRSGVDYGGSCFPKDVKALSHFARELKSPMHLLEKTTEVNAYQPIKAVEHLIDVVGDLTNRDVGVFGLSFKPHTEDIREAPAKIIINELLTRHANIHCWDPKAESSMAVEFPSLCYHDSIIDTFDHVDSAIIVTDWPELKDFFASNKPSIPIIDGRGVYPDADRSIGRTRVKDLFKAQNLL